MIARWRVFLGFVAGFLFILLAHPGGWVRTVLGLLVGLAGLALRGWAAGFLEKGKRLAQDGPYAVFRHPLYTGSFLAALGFMVAGTGSDRWIHAVFLWTVFLVLFGWIYPRRIVEEEATLAQHFGDAWRAFTGRNRRFLPTWPPFRRPDADRFDWARYKKNKEFNAAMGGLAGLAVIVVKAVLGW